MLFRSQKKKTSTLASRPKAPWPRPASPCPASIVRPGSRGDPPMRARRRQSQAGQPALPGPPGPPGPANGAPPRLSKHPTAPSPRIVSRLAGPEMRGPVRVRLLLRASRSSTAAEPAGQSQHATKGGPREPANSRRPVGTLGSGPRRPRQRGGGIPTGPTFQAGLLRTSAALGARLWMAYASPRRSVPSARPCSPPWPVATAPTLPDWEWCTGSPRGPEGDASCALVGASFCERRCLSSPPCRPAALRPAARHAQTRQLARRATRRPCLGRV